MLTYYANQDIQRHVKQQFELFTAAFLMIKRGAQRRTCGFSDEEQEQGKFKQALSKFHKARRRIFLDRWSKDDVHRAGDLLWPDPLWPAKSDQLWCLKKKQKSSKHQGVGGLGPEGWGCGDLQAPGVGAVRRRGSREEHTVKPAPTHRETSTHTP